jgi:hypothetical protein
MNEVVLEARKRLDAADANLIAAKRILSEGGKIDPDLEQVFEDAFEKLEDLHSLFFEKFLRIRKGT